MIKFEPGEVIRIDRTGVHVNPAHEVSAITMPVLEALDAHIKHLVRTVTLEEREACAEHAEEFLTRGRSPLARAVGNAIRARPAP